MKSTFINDSGQIVATGTIKPLYIDLILADGSRFFSTQSDNFTLSFLRSLEIKNIIKGAK